MNAIDLASLLCSRLCHDLLSPVGALNNGLELMADEQDPEMRQRCLDLLAESAKASANKLKFFRLAFGAGGGYGTSIDTQEARAALEGLFGGDHSASFEPPAEWHAGALVDAGFAEAGVAWRSGTGAIVAAVR